MGGEERRRSPRHLLDQSAEIHIGPKTVLGVVQDVSAHGMGLVLPGDTVVAIGETIWVLVESVANYAITATVRRITEDGHVGVEFEEVLSGEALCNLESLPMADPEVFAKIES